ncbi:MAG: cysteine--tRNA ligase [Candidatus Rokubacteria bacterium]|nr:cysteine--tRNA ligase [Candidatus Rokubacteria bacterium]
MSLRVCNTLTRRKEPFVPATPGEVRMYVCGVTVYGLAHMGHARSALVFDVIRRYLTFRGYRVRFVKNFTDVDDRIIARAAQTGETALEVADRYIAAERRDMAGLGIIPPDVEPRATEHIPQMIALIERLLAAGVAYVLDGDVYFEVRRFPGYGRLSGRDLEELRAGARVAVDERKRDPLDFALWKAAKPGEPAWPSPWGPGRPGWHIECSAMSMEYFGPGFDLHGGGEDLVFPHHENEIAQSEAATGRPFVRYWIHCAFVNFAGEKMSKSLGNVVTVEDALRRHEPDAIRMALLGTHYRHPLDFAEPRLKEAASALERLRGLLDVAANEPAPGGSTEAVRTAVEEVERRFIEAMDDDFNTPQALAALFDLARTLHAARNAGSATVAPGVAALRRLGGVLGLFTTAAVAPPPALLETIERLVRLRGEARQRRAWAEVDTMRFELTALRVTMEDTPSGTAWKWRPPPTDR